MALSELDKNLLDRCLQRKPRAWEDFIDRYIGLVYHIIQQTAYIRGIKLREEDRNELVNEAFTEILANDMSLLRRFEGNSSLATYLTVVIRRVIVRCLLQHRLRSVNYSSPTSESLDSTPDKSPSQEVVLQNREEVERMLQELDVRDAQVVRMYHLEGKSYAEIASALKMAENSIGPILSRAREKMRTAAE